MQVCLTFSYRYELIVICLDVYCCSLHVVYHLHLTLRIIGPRFMFIKAKWADLYRL